MHRGEWALVSLNSKKMAMNILAQTVASGLFGKVVLSY